MMHRRRPRGSGLRAHVWPQRAGSVPDSVWQQTHPQWGWLRLPQGLALSVCLSFLDAFVVFFDLLYKYEGHRLLLQSI